MKNVSLFARRAAAAVGIAAVATAVAAVGDVAAANAAVPHADGAVLVKKVTSARGTLEIFEGAAPGSVVTPHSSYGCAGSDPSVCLDIEGSGLYVDHMQNDTYVRRSGGMDLQINGPGGIIVDSGWFTAYPGHHYAYWWPRGYVARGYYCATAYVGGGHEGACNTVHN
ncbi:MULTISPECIES: hypothetical protein [Amycolatopsis]|uniref:Secreted protein n=1 Tax=Amycolatopsis dendrobii TaxID=2760662 RepID=A0A7W3ZEV3_9PSEU|nr:MULTISPECIES: hypothetical protein [Amycolatopsis]MBB1158442.1 hypothetical protein [Amycolatopsis dendrobii]UKD56947.1 hypothetical protein L3Q65_09560 [Amycolatopsis sp. FU40]